MDFHNLEECKVHAWPRERLHCLSRRSSPFILMSVRRKCVRCGSNHRSFSLIAPASIRREVSAKHDYSSGGDAGNEQIVETVDNSRGPFPPFSNTDTKRF